MYFLGISYTQFPFTVGKPINNILYTQFPFTVGKPINNSNANFYINLIQ